MPTPSKKTINVQKVASKQSSKVQYSENPDAERSKIKSKFVDASLSNIGDLVAEFSQSTDMPLEERLTFLNNITNLTNNWIDNITPQVPDKAPALWAERGKENRFMCPCDFVIEHYPSYDFELTITDIRHLDRPLYDALYNWIKKHGSWPDEFYLPTKEEKYDQILAAMSDADITKMYRLVDASKNRDKKLKLEK